MAKAQAQEPSMEEILASIRRIIADEDTGASAASKLASVAAKTQPAPTVSEDELDKLFDTGDDDVLELGDADKEPADDDMDLSFEPAPVVKPQPAPAPVAKVEPEPVVKVAPAPIAPPRAVEPPVAEVRRAPQPEPQPQPDPAPVRAAAPETMTDPLLSQSTDSMVSAAFDNLALSILNKNARTVEDLIQDMLRPMLRSWLDQNLPSLVERLVRAEIERVARGR
jgi:cell pole-organizing protein PopZ